MGLSLEQLEELREECMAEDVEITPAMFAWTEDRARLFFENGGEEEHEVTAWLRELDLLVIEAAVRSKVDNLASLGTQVADSIAAEGGSDFARNIGADKVIASLGVAGSLSSASKIQLRKALQALAAGGGEKKKEPKESAESDAAAKAKQHWLPGAMPLAMGKKVIVCDVKDEPEINGKVAEIMVGDGMPAFADPASGGKYCVKLMHGMGQGVTGRAQNTTATLRFLKPTQLLLHPDQIEKDRLLKEDNAIVLLGGDEAERAARAALYEMRLDPQHWYDQAVDRILNARHEFDVLKLEPRWMGGELGVVKRAYRKTSASVHPDKNKHPQAVDAFRKVYGTPAELEPRWQLARRAFETLLDLKQQWRLLYVLDKLQGDEVSLYDLEAEEEERFEWWWQANVPEMERQAAEAEGGEFEQIGEQWISDGLGDSVDDVQWIGPTAAMRLHEEKGAIFIDCRERWEYDIEKITGAHCVPMRAFVDFGLAGVAGDWVSEVVKTRSNEPLVPIIIYSEVATPFSRCRALSRWLLRAGHKGTISAARLRRLRGGVFGWRYNRGPLQLALTYVSPEERAKKKAQDFTNVANLSPRTEAGFNVRVRIASLDHVDNRKEDTSHELLAAEQAAGRPSVLLCDSSARVLLELPSEEGLATARALLCEIAKAEGAALVRGLEVVMFADRTLRVKLGAQGSVAKLDGMAIGFFAPLLSSKPWAVDEGAAEAEEEEPATKDAVEIA